VGIPAKAALTMIPVTPTAAAAFQNAADLRCAIWSNLVLKGLGTDGVAEELRKGMRPGSLRVKSASTEVAGERRWAFPAT
jgi:hypothetical protein